MRYVAFSGYGYDLKHLNDETIEFDMTEAQFKLDYEHYPEHADLISPQNANFGLLLLIPAIHQVAIEDSPKEHIVRMTQDDANKVLETDTYALIDALLEKKIISADDAARLKEKAPVIIKEHACFDYDAEDDWVNLM